jgi:hypothetical protein
MSAILTEEQMAAFQAKLKAQAAKAIGETQAGVDRIKGTMGATLSRSEKGTVSGRVFSPLTGREVVVFSFDLEKAAEHDYVETLIANEQPKVLTAYAEDYIREQLLANVRL